MPIPGYPERPVVRQRFFSYALAVAAAPAVTQVNNDPSLHTNYLNTFIISVPAAGGNVYLGSAGVSQATGLELIAGSGPLVFAIDQARQFYEIQDPTLQIAAIANCKNPKPQMIPFVVWDLTQLFLTAPVLTNIVVGFTFAEFV
jgi:hypothetical protein